MAQQVSLYGGKDSYVDKVKARVQISKARNNFGQYDSESYERET